MLPTPQLYLMQSAQREGFPANFLPIFLQRCGAVQNDYDALLAGGLVEAGERIRLTKAGKKVYKTEQRKGYF